MLGSVATVIPGGDISQKLKLLNSRQVRREFKMARLIALYLVAIVSANLILTHFGSIGPELSIGTAFAFIGLDLTSRDRLHDYWQRSGLWWKMGILIGMGSLLSWVLNQDAQRIATASFCAFAVTGLADTLVYWVLGSKTRFLRVNGSNVVGSAIDSTIFPTLAFGAMMPHIVAGQFVAKVFGGFIWSLVLKHDDNADK